MISRKTYGFGLTLAACAAGVSSALADTNFYVGADVLASQLEPRVSDTSYSVTGKDSVGVKILAGIDFDNRFSIEGYYSQLGSAQLNSDTNSGEIEYQTGGVSGLAYLYSSGNIEDRQGLMLFARVGVGFLDNNSTNDIPFRRLNNEHFATGLGLEYNFNSGLGLRGEFLNHDVDAQHVSIGLVKRFGRSTSAPVIAEPESKPESTADSDTAANAPESVAPPPPPPPKPVTKVIADSDGDGVNDDYDLCAGTAANVTVAENGCGFAGVLQGVNFQSGSASLSEQASNVLDGVINELGANPNIKISVQSHTDNQGSAASNMELSRQRAVTVVRYLADVGAIDLSRMSAVGFGESQPLQSNSTAEGRAANRRVEIEIVSE